MKALQVLLIFLTSLLWLLSCGEVNLSDARYDESVGDSDVTQMGLIKVKKRFTNKNGHSIPFKAGMKGYAVYRVPTMVIHKNKKGKETILAFAEGRVGGHEDEGDIDVVLRRSTNGGKSWKPLQILANHKKNPCKNPSPVVLPNGRIILLYLWNKHIPGGDESKRTTRKTYMIYSDDAGKTWTSSKKIEPWGTVGFGKKVNGPRGINITSQTQEDDWGWTGLGPVHGIVKQRGRNKGRIIFPARHSIKGTPTRAHIIYSDDKGKSWSIGAIASRLRTTESTVVELSDGRIMLNSRDQNDAYTKSGKHLRWVSISNHGGGSFQESYVARNLIEPKGVQASLLYHSYNKKTKKGNILFSNPANIANRCNGTLRLSTNDGKTWPQEYVYAPDTCDKTYFTGYSDLANFKNGDVGILYERGKNFKDSTVRYEEIAFTKVKIKPNEGQTSLSDEPSKCMIIKPTSCPKQPGFKHKNKSSFLDNYENAGTDQARCLKRAKDYFNWCGFGPREVVKARFYTNGIGFAELSYQLPKCEITMLSSCPKRPNWTNNNKTSFLDNFENAGNDRARCLKRAKDYFGWCGFGKGQKVTAKFYTDGGIVHTQKTHRWNGKGCEIIKPNSCPKRPRRWLEKETSFWDDYQNSGTDQVRCLKRAKEYFDWCGFRAGQVVKAKFYDGGVLLKKKSYNAR